MKIYLINGESYLLVNEKINEIVKDNKNITVFDLIENSLEDVILEAGYFSMFLESKFIIVKNANFFGSDKLKEKDTELLLNYLKEPNTATTIIFVCNSKLDMRKKITKEIKDKYSIISIPNLKYYEIENRIRDLFVKNHYTIDNESIKYIVANSLNNYDVAVLEARKLLLYYLEPQNISYQDVKAIISTPINSNQFLFVDAIVENNLEDSLKYLKDLKTLKVEPTVLVSLIARDFRIMYQIKQSLEQNRREYEIMTELGLQDWQFDKYLKKIFPYKIKELESILLKLSKLDLDLKSGKIDKNIALELFILDICE